MECIDNSLSPGIEEDSPGNDHLTFQELLEMVCKDIDSLKGSTSELNVFMSEKWGMNVQAKWDELVGKVHAVIDGDRLSEILLDQKASQFSLDKSKGLI